ncbi:tetratricopeptide repeat protein [Roseivirga misakiensis]|uniref:Uncharacterized protein n=1 Tax=Roseivirga misakiensis TaxID=1563681 RepID=A0A1E5SZU5_9BACT|nr:hypothetical protein [Roseivirga misakiensis]OEK04629.1 hypothetical protein BFP71_14330 [Roseivirga misakiensis]
MKKLVFTVALSILAMGVYAQKKVLKSAEKALRKGDYEQAATLAKQAADNAETQENPSVYTVLGKVSLQNYIAGGFDNIADAEESLKQFNKAIELSDEKNKAKLMENPIFNPLDPTKQIDGGEAYGLLEHHLTMESNKALDEENFEKAHPMLNLLYEMDPTQIERAFFAGYSAQNADLDEVALKFYKIVMNHEGEFDNKEYALKSVISMSAESKDYDTALAAIRKGKEAYPDDKWYSTNEVNLLLESDRIDEAISGLMDIVNAGGAAKENYYTLAFLMLNKDDFVQAEKYAKVALEMDPNYSEVFYVLGSAIYNQAADIMTNANTEIDDDAKYEALKNQALEKFKESMPMFQKMLELDGNDLYALRPLSTIYDQLKMTEKRDELLDKIDKLEGGN